MNEWMQMVSSSDAEYEWLFDELRNGGGLYVIDARMPKTCGNIEATIEFRYYGENKITLTCVQTPVRYRGSSPEIARWLESGVAEFDSLEKMKAFLRGFCDDSFAKLNHAPEIVGGGNEMQEEEMIYDRENLSVPATEKYIRLDRDKLVRELNKEFSGMEENILKISHLVCNHIGRKGKDKPLSIFLYGPPGTGKSDFVKEMVKRINAQLDKKKQFKYKDIDCTQCQEREDVNKIIGAPPGYIGHDEPGIFSILEENPNAVFVFEEITRATGSVSEVIMQAMENGRQATNGKRLKNGEDYYDLSHSIIFFTSNINLDDKRGGMGFSINDESDFEEKVKSALPESPAEIARLISRESTAAREKLLESGKFDVAVISRMNAVFRFDRPCDDTIIDIAAKFIRNLARDGHKLRVTRLEAPIFREFLNAAVSKGETFNPRVLREEVRNYFDFAFEEYANAHEDYERVTISGSLSNIIISPSLPAAGVEK